MVKLSRVMEVVLFGVVLGAQACFESLTFHRPQHMLFLCVSSDDGFIKLYGGVKLLNEA